MAVARASVADIRSESLAVRAAPALAACIYGHLRSLLTRQVEPELHCLKPSLVEGDRQHFCFQATRPEQGDISPSSKFKISSDSYIDIDSLFGCLVLRAFRSLLRRSRCRSRAWVTGRRNRQCGRSSLSSDFDDVCHCEGKCAERGTSSRNGCRRSCQHRLCCGIRTLYVTKTWRLKKRTCGKLWGRPARRPRTFEGDAQGPCMSSVQLLSARRCTFEHCTSSCSSRDATMVVLNLKKKKKKKKKRQRRLPLHEKNLSRVGANVGSEMFSQVRSLAADRVSPPVSKRQNNHLAPMLQAQLEKVASTSLATIGARLSFSDARLAHEFPRFSWWPPLFFPTQNG